MLTTLLVHENLQWINLTWSEIYENSRNWGYYMLVESVAKVIVVSELLYMLGIVFCGSCNSFFGKACYTTSSSFRFIVLQGNRRKLRYR